MTVTSADHALSTDEDRVEQLCDELLAAHDPKSTPPAEFLGARFDLGLAWVQFPEGLGGLGGSPRLQKLVDDRLGPTGAPELFARNPIGYGMAGPTVLTHDHEQRHRFLRPLFTGEEVWCQLFSEPGAGSDVASLATRAVRDGDEWVVNGQKVWTTVAHIARWGLLVARTDPEQPKHRGLTYFVVDMQATGVEVKPLYQITGEAEFNEVFFTDVRVPDSARLGDVGDGWRVSLTTLMNERVAIGGGVGPRGSGLIGETIDLWRKGGHIDPARRDHLMRLWVWAEVIRLTNLRSQQLRSLGRPDLKGSIGKVASADFNRAVTEFCIELLGPEGMLYPSGYTMERPVSVLQWSDPQKAFLRTRANSIEGGTSEIMRNILGERLLGLPGDVRVDKELPWSRVPRN